jgi:hypothetical protein
MTVLVTKIGWESSLRSEWQKCYSFIVVSLSLRWQIDKIDNKLCHKSKPRKYFSWLLSFWEL